MNHYAPPLFGWIWGILGASQGVLIIIFQALISVLCLFPVMRLAKLLAEPAPLWAAAGFVAFQASMMRYGMQPLPDTLFLLLQLCLLAELASEKARSWKLIVYLLLLAWTRYDVFLFYGLYFVWTWVLGRGSKKVYLALLCGIFLGLGSLTLNSYLRYDSLLPSNRFEALFPPVGEDQLVRGQTLWQVWANEGRLAPEFSEEEIVAASAERHGRETENTAQVSGLFKNFYQLLVFKLWGRELCGPFVLILICMAMWKAPRKVWCLLGLAICSVGIYSFLGVKERYLIFATPLLLILAARGLASIKQDKLRVAVFVLLILYQIKVGAYQYNHPEVMLQEYRQAGEWIAGQKETEGPIMSREGIASIYAGREWRRLPTSNSWQALNDYAKQEGVSYIVVGTRYFVNKRPWQKFLLEKCEAENVKTFESGPFKCYVYKLP